MEITITLNDKGEFGLSMDKDIPNVVVVGILEMVKQSVISGNLQITDEKEQEDDNV